MVRSLEGISPRPQSLVLTAVAAISLLFSSGVAQATISEVIVVRDECSGRIVAMNTDGTGRHDLADVGNRRFSDVSRAGPITVIGTTWTVPGDRSSPIGLYALDATGTNSPAWLLQGHDAEAGFWTFSPDGAHVAAARAVTDAAGVAHENVEIWDVVRDATTGRITSLTNVSVVADLLAIGARTDSNASDFPGPGTGSLDFSRDGQSLVAVVYDDLWRLDLAPGGHALLGATPLTRTKDFAEGGARWSPTADVIAYSGGPYSTVHLSSGSATALKTTNYNIYTLTLVTGAVRSVTTSGGASAAGPEYPSWSRDGTSLIFDAPGTSAKRTSPCGAANRDI